MSSKQLSVRIISVIISLTFLLTSVTLSYASSALRPNLMGDKGVGGNRLSATAEGIESESSDAAYAKIAAWIVTNTHIDIAESPAFVRETIIEGLRNGKVVYEGKSFYGEVSGNMGGEDYSWNMKVNLRRRVILIHEGLQRRWDTSSEWTYGATEWETVSTKAIPEDILKSLSKLMGLETSSLGIKYDWQTSGPDSGNIALSPMVWSKVSWLTSRIQLWKLRLSKMTDEDMGKCLRSLGKDVPTKPSLKAAIAKKLTKLQQKRSETIPIIREKALALLEIDEANFRDVLQPFIGDYIAIRDAIRTAGIADDTAEFYILLDGIAGNSGVSRALPTLVKTAKNADEFKLFVNLGIELGNNGIDSYYILTFLIPPVAKVVTKFSDLKNICEDLLALDIELSKKRSVKDSPFSIKKKYGDFDIEYKYTQESGHPEDSNIMQGSDLGFNWVVDMPEMYGIQVLPSDSTGTKLVSGHTVNPLRAGNLLDVLSNYDKLSWGGSSKESSFFNQYSENISIFAEFLEDNTEKADNIMRQFLSRQLNSRLQENFEEFVLWGVFRPSEEKNIYDFDKHSDKGIKTLYKFRRAFTIAFCRVARKDFSAAETWFFKLLEHYTSKGKRGDYFLCFLKELDYVDSDIKEKIRLSEKCPEDIRINSDKLADRRSAVVLNAEAVLSLRDRLDLNTVPNDAVVEAMKLKDTIDREFLGLESIVNYELGFLRYYEKLIVRIRQSFPNLAEGLKGVLDIVAYNMIYDYQLMEKADYGITGREINILQAYNTSRGSNMGDFLAKIDGIIDKTNGYREEEVRSLQKDIIDFLSIYSRHWQVSDILESRRKNFITL